MEVGRPQTFVDSLKRWYIDLGGGMVRPNLIWQVLLALSVAISGNAWGWGSTAHKFINQYAVVHLPPSLAQLTAQQQFLANHASDADDRKSVDATEAPKHYIDLESYPDYQHLPSDLTLLIAQYGWATVEEIGILPWATVWALDSLTVQLQRSDLTKAYQTAADLGHYVGDAHQPLHCTVNYNGQLTGNYGIHSRFESEMINIYQNLLSVSPDSVHYVTDPYSYTLNYMLHSLTFVDSIMQADNVAKAVSGWNGSGTPPQTYYAALWQRTQRLTTTLIQQATVNLASLWYTAWVNAGLVTTVAANEPTAVPETFALFQNFPNPFNPSTAIRYSVPQLAGQNPAIVGRFGDSDVRLAVYDPLGREVAVLVNERKAPGTYEVQFNGSGLSSGVYFYRISVVPLVRVDEHHIEFVQTKRLLLLR